MSMPDEIYLTLDDGELDSYLWCQDRVTDDDLLYHSDAKYKALEARIEAAEKLCEVYFYIASQVIGEDEVRKKVNARIDK